MVLFITKSDCATEVDFCVFSSKFSFIISKTIGCCSVSQNVKVHIKRMKLYMSLHSPKPDMGSMGLCEGQQPTAAS